MCPSPAGSCSSDHPQSNTFCRFHAAPPLLEPACTRTRPGYWKPRYLLSCKRESAVAQQRRAGARLKNILGQTCAPEGVPTVDCQPEVPARTFLKQCVVADLGERSCCPQGPLRRACAYRSRRAKGLAVWKAVAQEPHCRKRDSPRDRPDSRAAKGLDRLCSSPGGARRLQQAARGHKRGHSRSQGGARTRGSPCSRRFHHLQHQPCLRRPGTGSLRPRSWPARACRPLARWSSLLGSYAHTCATTPSRCCRYGVPPPRERPTKKRTYNDTKSGLCARAYDSARRRHAR